MPGGEHGCDEWGSVLRVRGGEPFCADEDFPRLHAHGEELFCRNPGSSARRRSLSRRVGRTRSQFSLGSSARAFLGVSAGLAVLDVHDLAVVHREHPEKPHFTLLWLSPAKLDGHLVP
jgi:hypothetical protein